MYNHVYAGLMSSNMHILNKLDPYSMYLLEQRQQHSDSRLTNQT